jgi:hypothetical protein
MRHDIDSCDQDDEDQDNAWLDGPVVKVKGKSRLRSEGPCNMGSRQRYNHRAILFCTQDTIEGVSGLGSIAELLRGEVLSVTRCTGATR